jgi:hypothetical protein
MKNGERAIVIAQTEIKSSLPVGLRYFQAVDAMTDGVELAEGRYFNILVYSPDENQPAVKILRFQVPFEGSITQKQDEINLTQEKQRLQFNAQVEAGEYVVYPEDLGPDSMEYLEKVVEVFTELGRVDRSSIYINRELRFVSKDGVWVQIQDWMRKPPRLGEPPPGGF